MPDGLTLIELHRQLLDRAMRAYFIETDTTRKRAERRIVRAHAMHVAIVENTYYANPDSEFYDPKFVVRVEKMAVERVRTGRVRLCPKCHVGLMMAHGMCSKGHDPSRY